MYFSFRRANKMPTVQKGKPGQFCFLFALINATKKTAKTAVGETEGHAAETIA